MDRYAELAAAREALLDAIEESEKEMMDAWNDAMDAAGTARGASLTAEHARATSHYTCALEAFEEWITSPDGIEYETLDEKHGGIYG